MHQTLHIPEILLNIFGHCSTDALGRLDLAVLARTCRAFKEPALDVLWEELQDLSPLVRCIPEACHLAEHLGKQKRLCRYYSFSRPLKEAEWDTLRGYTRRIRSIRVSLANITAETLGVIFSLAPSDGPLLPHIRSLYWSGTFVLPHVAVPSLKALHLRVDYMPLPTFKEFIDAFGDRCPHMESLVIDHDSFTPDDSAISRLVPRWPHLQRVSCSDVTLRMDAISHLSSACHLKSLEFTLTVGLVQDIVHLGSVLVFPSLTSLGLTSSSLHTIMSLFRYIQLPTIETLSVVAHEYISRPTVQAYWAAVREVYPSNVPTFLKIFNTLQEEEEEEEEEGIPLEEPPPRLTLDVLGPCTAFSDLRGLDVDFAYPVSLTDADILELASPRMAYFLVNYERGWKIDTDPGGITFSGLVRLLQTCPSLNRLCLAIDARTFIEIPEGLDVPFLARQQLDINLVDTYILREFVPGLVSVFTALGLDPARVFTGFDYDYDEEFRPLRKSLLDVQRDGS